MDGAGVQGAVDHVKVGQETHHRRALERQAPRWLLFAECIIHAGEGCTIMGRLSMLCIRACSSAAFSYLKDISPEETSSLPDNWKVVVVHGKNNARFGHAGYHGQ